MIFVSSTFVKHCFIDSATGATDAQFAKDCFLSNNSVLTLAKCSFSSLKELKNLESL